MFKKLFIADFKMMLRNRQALFWAFMFPLIFAMIFGLFFGKNSTSGSVAIVNKSSTDIAKNYVTALKDAEIFKIVEDKSLEDAKSDIKKNKLLAVVEIPQEFGKIEPQLAKPYFVPDSAKPALPKHKVKLIFDPGNTQVAAALIGFTDKYLSKVNLAFAGAEEIFVAEIEKTTDKDLTYFDFILAGILGLAIMNSSVIGISVAMSKYREDKILKRITTTPLPPSIFIISQVLTRLILNLAQITAILLVGIYVFDANIYGNILILVMVALFGALLFQLLGFVVSAFSKTTDAAQGLATFVTIPMMFLAGVFFPIDSLPEWLSKIVQYLPLAPLLRILRAVALDNNSPFVDMRNVYIVLAWIAGLLLIALWRFRLSEE